MARWGENGKGGFWGVGAVYVEGGIGIGKGIGSGRESVDMGSERGERTFVKNVVRYAERLIRLPWMDW